VSNSVSHQVGSKGDRSKVTRGENRPRKFQPFYEAVTVGLPGPALLIWKVGLAVALGIAFLLALFITIGKGIFADWAWLLSLMITTSLLSLYYATDALRRLFPHMDSRLHEHGEPFSRARQTYYRTLRKRLSDRAFVGAGVFFGIVNCVMGYLFGVPTAFSWVGRIAIFSAFFVVGFICGMAALAIYAILETVRDFVRAPHLELDYSAPDGCGGMRFLGEALVKFGSVTLIMGVLIAIYIVNFPWAREGNFLVRGFRWFWIAWPFALSLIVLLAPSAEISGVLSDYKVARQDELDERLAELRKSASNPSLASSDRAAARKDYEYYSKQRQDVYHMSTWPYGFGSSVKYASVLIANAGALAISSAKTIIEKLLK